MRSRIAGVSADPGTSCEEVSSKLKETYPNGFAYIPNESGTLSCGRASGNLIDYKSSELSEQAAALIDWELEKI